MAAMLLGRRTARRLAELSDLNWTHPSLNGLFDAYNFSASSGTRSILTGANDWTLYNTPTLNRDGLNTNGSSSYARLSSDRGVYAPPFTVMLVGRRTSGSVMWSKLRVSAPAWYGRYSSTLANISSVENNAFDGDVSTSAVEARPDLQGQGCMVAVVTSSRLMLAYNGNYVGEDISFSGPNISGAQNAIGCSYLNNTAANFAAGVVSLHFEWSRAFPDDEAVSLSRTPQALFKSTRSRKMFLPGVTTSGAIPLAGAAAASATATGQLLTEIKLSASALSSAQAAGGMTTAIKLAGVAVSSVTATASFASDVALAGVATAQVGATGDLTTQIPMASSALGLGTAAGALTTQIVFSGAALAQAMATASLPGTAAQLFGDAVAVAVADGSMTTAIPLSGVAASVSLADGMLTISVLLSGAALARATASADLSGGTPAALFVNGVRNVWHAPRRDMVWH